MRPSQSRVFIPRVEEVISTFSLQIPDSFPPQKWGWRMTHLDWSILLFLWCAIHFSEECASRSIAHKTLTCGSAQKPEVQFACCWRGCVLLNRRQTAPTAARALREPHSAASCVTASQLLMLMLFNTKAGLLIFTVILSDVTMNKTGAASYSYACREWNKKLFFFFLFFFSESCVHINVTKLGKKKSSSKHLTCMIRVYFCTTFPKPGTTPLSVPQVPPCANMEIYVWQSIRVNHVNFTKTKNIVEKILSQEHT